MRIIINAVNLVSAGTLGPGKQFLSALASIDHENLYLVVVPLGYGYEEIVSGGNFRLKFYPRVRWFYKLWRIYQDFAGLKSLVRSSGADVVLVLGNFSPVDLGVPTAVLFQNSYYVDLPNFTQLGKKTPIFRMLKRLEMLFFYLTTKHADAFIVHSKYTKRRLSQRWNVLDSKIEVIPNALSTKLINSTGRNSCKITKNIDGKFRMIYVSRYYPHKNHEFILKLARRFQANGRDDLIFIVTLDERLNGVKTIVKEIHDSGLDDFICNIGEVPHEELAGWYSSSDILLFPSYLETFGNAFIEAMSFGLPICAVDLPYARSVCDDAALYYQKDSLEDAAEKILKLKNDMDFRREMSAKSKERLKEFPSWEEVAKRYLSILETIAN